MGGAEISTKRTAPSLRTFSVSKTNWPSRLVPGVLTIISPLPEKLALLTLRALPMLQVSGRPDRLNVLA